jgi:hypothetical protein
VFFLISYNVLIFGIQVRHLEGKRAEDISREHLVKLFSEDPPLTPINLKQRAANLRLLDIY